MLEVKAQGMNGCWQISEILWHIIEMFLEEVPLILHFVETPIHSLKSALKDANIPKDGQIILEQR